jgi:hypothetical protein
VYVVLPGAGKRTEGGRIPIPIQGQLQLSMIGETLDSAEKEEAERLEGGSEAGDSHVPGRQFQGRRCY